MKNKAKYYYWGIRGKQDLTKALGLYLQAAERGDAMAQFIAGGMYYKGYGTSPDKKKAFSLLYNAAQNDVSTVESQKLLGKFFIEGQIVPQNFKEAEIWFLKAAEAGDADSQSELAYIYFTGKNGIHDYEKSYYWYELAAQQGLAIAQYSLGIMYFEGYEPRGRDLTLAYAWMSLAASQNNYSAIQALNYFGTLLTQEELTLAQKKALDLYTEIEENQKGN